MFFVFQYQFGLVGRTLIAESEDYGLKPEPLLQWHVNVPISNGGTIESVTFCTTVNQFLIPRSDGHEKFPKIKTTDSKNIYRNKSSSRLSGHS